MSAQANPRVGSEELLERVQSLSAAVEELPDGYARELAQELVSAVIAVYGDGLRRIMETIGRARDAGATILDELAQDGAVGSLLLIHDLYPVSLEDRVREALDTVRPYMESHGGDVELVSLHDGVARLVLQGSCNGCAASRATLELAIAQALEEHAPDLAGLEVEGVAASTPGPFELPMVNAGGSPLPMAEPERPPPRRVPLDIRGGSTATIERCDMCGALVPDDHRHLLHLEERRIVCACEACWALRSGDPEYRPSGMRTIWLQRFDCDEELWRRFGIPIGLAFFMRSTVSGGVVAFYPSPAGATESELSLEAWDALVERNPGLAGLEPDAEALVVNRLAAEHEYVIAPIDQCYALVGLIKSTWEGISGGAALRESVPAFFAELRRRAVVR